jgi:hypothetical protein
LQIVGYKESDNKARVGYSTYYKQKIFLFSHTIHDDPIWEDLRLPKTHTYDDWDEKIVGNIMAFASTHDGALLILDDMITSSEAINAKRGNLLKKLFYQGRHHKISIILVTKAQGYSPWNANKFDPHYLLQFTEQKRGRGLTHQKREEWQDCSRSCRFHAKSQRSMSH